MRIVIVRRIAQVFFPRQANGSLIVAADGLGNFISGKISGNATASKAGLRLMR